MKQISFLIFCIVLLFSGCEKKEQQKVLDKTKPYEGKSIMVLVPTLNADLVRGPFLKNKKEFENKTGAKVRIVTPNWSETIKSIEESMKKDSDFFYDIYVVIGLWNGTLLANSENIAQVPQSVKEKLQWEDVLPIYKNNILKWDNKTYGIPYDGDNINLYYRKDIFNNTQYQQWFFKDYGYKLQPPKTWKQYIDIAKFFNGWDWDNDGKVEYGNAGLRVKGDVSLLQFFAYAGAYGKCLENDSYYFDINTMDARINTQGFVRALTEYIELIGYGPKGMKNFAGHDVRDAFVKGEVALAIDWTDLGIMAANSPYSTVKNKIGYDVLPGSNEVYSCKEKRWIKVFNAPSSISGNWTIMVSNKSKNKDLAFDFATFIASKHKLKEYITDPGTAVNPSRYSQLEDIKPWVEAGFSKNNASEYTKVITKSLNNQNVITDILIPGGAKYYQILDTYVYDAIQGKYTPKEALDLAAKKWDQLTDSLGREKQKDYYKKSLNIK